MRLETKGKPTPYTGNYVEDWTEAKGVAAHADDLLPMNNTLNTPP